VEPGLRALPDGSFARTEVVTPSMCGHNSLFPGRLGDWTWDAVSAACDVDAYRAHDAGGAPTYLSFHYFRIRAGDGLDPLRLTFGDRLDVVSRVFALGSESLLTVHRVEHDDGSLDVENVNRWISRSRPDTNRGLVRAVPAGFDHHRLPAATPDLDPRLAYTGARRDLTFRPSGNAGTPLHLDYPVEASRDLNGVGLLYFASYFSVVDWALVRLWRHLGRDTADFLGRAVLDHQLLYLGNADADGVLALEVSTREAGAAEVVDTVIRDRGTAEVLAISTQLVTRQEATR
jgi:probable biosynthetic protein (TIGR04098 family)